LITPASRAALTVAAVGERGLIDRIRKRLPPPPTDLLVAVGDDAAVVQPERGTLQVLTTDALVEGVHFDRRYSSPSDIGYKALAVNVSDIAAMGGTPRFALLSLMLPETLLLDDVDALLEGFLEMAGAVGVALAGGNITRSPGPLVLDVTVVGSVRPRRILRREGGKAGDALFVTGSLGAGVAGLAWLKEHTGRDPEDPDIARCVQRYRRPEPRTRAGVILGRTRAASACMDLSDGLADGVRQIAEASGTGARIDAALVPVDPGAVRWFALSGDPVMASLSGGDDYELLFTVPARSRGRLRTVISQSRGLPVTRIGELTVSRELLVVRGEETVPLPAGFAHF
jgi:thiamine-monophosphate kinase